MSHHFHSRLRAYGDTLSSGFHSVNENRKKELSGIAGYIRRSLSAGKPCRLLFVCTHNSRRSQFAQVWMQTAAWYYGVEPVFTYSGGTEATAANQSVIGALERAGFAISSDHRTDGNHLYQVSPGDGYAPILLSSKLYGDPANPQQGFAAIMVCSDADEACPFVLGAEARFSLPFEDPKQFDGTGRESGGYDQSCREIGTEMFYVMRLVREE